MSTTLDPVAPPNPAVLSCGIGRELGEVLKRLETVRTVDRSRASDEQRLAWIEQIRAVQRRAEALTSVLIAEADEANSAMKARHTHLSDWLARSGQETPRQAAGALWTGRELERRPQVRDATTSGRITVQQAKAIGDALNALPTGLDSDQKRRAEDLILAEADHTPPEKLRAMTGAILRRVSPDAESADQRADRLAARDARADQRRALRFGPEIDGSIELSGNLPVADGRRLERLVQTVADRAYRAAKDNADRQSLGQTPQQRLADALVTIVTAAEAAERGESSLVSIPAGAAQISVLMSARDLLDRANARGVLADGTELSPGDLRRLACSADLVPVVLGTGSTILDLGRTYRLAPSHLRHALGLRDGGCAFPGCTAPIWHCEAHHILPWQEGGLTDLGNLVALCKVHHTLIEPALAVRRADGILEAVDQWTVRMDGRGLPEFIPPAALDASRSPIRPAAAHAELLFEIDASGP
jgi:hypothetical protein